MTNKKAAIKIIKRLRANGFEAFLAGGCVRDMLLGRRAKDYDVATDAHPEDVCSLFKFSLKVGAKFGVVMVMMGSDQVEVATFRAESGYSDGRHPDKVEFSSVAEDANRRDFTINGMFYDPFERRVIDFVNGQDDLRNRIIRTIGPAEIRFSEDYLRMLRAVRFCTQLDFTIAPQTWSAICGNAEKIARISGERIAMELEGILTDPCRGSGSALLVKSGLADAIFPGFSKEQPKFAVDVLAHLPRQIDFELALAGFFGGCRLEFCNDKFPFLKLSKNQNRHIRFLLENRGKLLDEEMPLAELKIILSEPYFRDLYELQTAIQKVNNQSINPLLKIRKRAQALAGRELRPRPLLDGHELIRLGAVPGPQVGELAQELYIAQLAEKLITPQQARAWVQQWLAKHQTIDD